VNVSGANLPALLLTDVGKRFTVKRRPPGGGTLISQDVHIEGITEDVNVQGTVWDIGLDVSSADPALSPWVVGTSALGTNTRIGY
jgi:hypothetical protein